MDDPDFDNVQAQQALANSYKDRAAEQLQLKAARYGREMMDSTILRLNNEFAPLDCKDGDTLVYIGPPPPAVGENYRDHQYVHNHFSIPHRVHSSKFKEMQSAKFQLLFGPKSARTERRLRKEGILLGVNTEGVKFFLDLRPPNEDDEAVVLLTTLTCTKGVLTWHAAQKKYDISPMLVAGQDDSSLMPVDFHSPVALSASSKIVDHKHNLDKDNAPGHKDEESDTVLGDGKFKPWSPNETTSPEPAPASLPEYSPLRHRSAIERLVQAVEHGDPKLDSAPKMWTFFAVAKYFDCASHERISGWIIKWLFAYPNCNFVQCNPEVAYLLGLGTMSVDATKDAFSILVGEKSLLDVSGESAPSILNPLVSSVHGRPIQLLDDDERNRIDHAAASLVRRMRCKFDDLVGEEMEWLKRSVEYKRLWDLAASTPEEVDLLKSFLDRTKQYVRGRIVWVLCRRYDADIKELESSLPTVRTFYPGTTSTFCETYNSLNEKARIFTRFFWMALKQQTLADGDLNTWTAYLVESGLPRFGPTELSQKMLDQTLPDGQRVMKVILKSELNQLARKLNQIWEKQRWQKQTASGSEAGQIHNIQNADSNSKSQRSTSITNLDGFEDLFLTSPKRDLPFAVGEPFSEKRRKLGVVNLTEPTSSLLNSVPDSLPWTPSVGDASAILDTRPHGPKSSTQRAPFANMTHADYTSILADEARRFAQPPNADISRMNAAEGVMWTRWRENGDIPLQQPEQAPAGSGTSLWSDDRQAFAQFLSNDFAPQQSNPGTSSSERIHELPGVDPYQRFQATQTVLPKAPEGHVIYRAPVIYRNTQSPTTTAEDYLREADDVEWNVTQGSTEGRVDNQAPEGLRSEGLVPNENVPEGRSRPKQQFSDYPDASHLQIPNSKFREELGQFQQQFSDLAKASYSEESPLNPSSLSVSMILSDIGNQLDGICNNILYPEHLFHGNDRLPTDLIDTLMSLKDDEWKYLPLWAGGNDDGSGGVFDEVDVPNLETGGFKGGKRGIGNVSGTVASSLSGSNFDDIASEAVSTVGKASKAATDGTQTVKSCSDVSEEDVFMQQNELWDEIQRMKTHDDGVVNGSAGDVHGKANATDNRSDSFELQDDEDSDTVTGGASAHGDNDVDIDTDDHGGDTGLQNVADHRDTFVVDDTDLKTEKDTKTESDGNTENYFNADDDFKAGNDIESDYDFKSHNASTSTVVNRRASVEEAFDNEDMEMIDMNDL